MKGVGSTRRGVDVNADAILPSLAKNTVFKSAIQISFIDLLFYNRPYPVLRR